MMPYIRLENTLLPALVHAWRDDRLSVNWDLFVSSIHFLCEKPRNLDQIHFTPAVFVDDPTLNIRFRRISFDFAWDFLGFMESDFLRSLFNFWESPPGTKGCSACRSALSDGTPLPDGLNEGQFDRHTPLWALVWFLFFEQGEPPIVRTYDELIEILAACSNLAIPLLRERLRSYSEFDPSDPEAIYLLGTAACRLQQFLVALRRDINRLTSGFDP
jgi:hypothetical protein